MTNAMLAAARRWLRYRQTLHALRRLDRQLLADLGLTEDNLARIADLAARKEKPITLFQALGHIKQPGEPAPQARQPVLSSPACAGHCRPRPA